MGYVRQPWKTYLTTVCFTSTNGQGKCRNGVLGKRGRTERGGGPADVIDTGSAATGGKAHVEIRSHGRTFQPPGVGVQAGGEPLQLGIGIQQLHKVPAKGGVGLAEGASVGEQVVHHRSFVALVEIRFDAQVDCG